MITVTVTNQKGGVGKTTTAVTIATGAARLGHRTLLLDLDPQGHAAYSLGAEKSSGVFRLIVSGDPLTSIVLPLRPGLDVLPGDVSTERAARWLAANAAGENVLRDLLIGANYELVVIDLAPSLSSLHAAALVMTDLVIVPSRLDFLALDGVAETLHAIQAVNRHAQPLDYRVLPTMLDRTTRESLGNLESLTKTYPDRLWPAIPQDVKLRECPAFGESIWDYAPGSNAVRGYPSGDHRTGGYAEVMRELETILNGR